MKTRLHDPAGLGARKALAFLYTNPDPHRRFLSPAALKSLDDRIICSINEQRYLLECALRVLRAVRGLTLPTWVIHIFRVFRIFRGSKFRCSPSVVRDLTFPNPCRSMCRGSTAIGQAST